MADLCRRCSAQLPEGALFCPSCGANQNPKRGKRIRGNGTGSVYKRGKVWQIEVTVGHKTIMRPPKGNPDGQARKVIVPDRRAKSGFLTKKAAEEYIPIFKAELAAQASAGASKRISEIATLKTLWRGYSKAVLKVDPDSAEKRKGKKHKYAFAFDRWDASGLSGLPVADLTIEVLQDAVDNQASTYDTRKDMKSILSILYQRAMAQQDVSINLAQFVVLPDPVEHEGVPFTEEEQAALWTHFAEGLSFAGYILFMIYSGAMPGEVLKIKKDMIDWEKRGIFGAGLKTKERKKTPIVICDIIVPVLQSLCESSDGDMLWPLSKDSFYERYYATLEVCGCRRLTPYSCRHTTGTALALNQIPDAVAQKVMRHANYRTTRKFYTHVENARALDAANKTFGIPDSVADKVLAIEALRHKNRASDG